MYSVFIDEEMRDLIPALLPEEYALLRDSIIADGCRDAILVWNGMIVDGHNRYMICTENGIEYETKEMQFDTRQDAMLWMLRNQLGRRNINAWQRSQIALKMEPLIAEKAKAKEHERKTTLPTLTKSFDPIDTRSELATIANVSTGTMAKAKKITNTATPETIKKLNAGEITINQAYKDVKREERRIEREAMPEPEIPNDKYQVVYADPPWEYNDKQDTEKLGGAVKHYGTMSISDLCEIPVGEITQDNAVLFLWVTSPLLESAFDIIKAWGFKYKSSFVWDKIKHNMGHYNSVRHEFLLICTKGSCTPDNIKLYDSVQSIERTEHSAKPDEFYEIIETLYNGNKLEMFARRLRSGWHQWGNEL